VVRNVKQENVVQEEWFFKMELVRFVQTIRGPKMMENNVAQTSVPSLVNFKLMELVQEVEQHLEGHSQLDKLHKTFHVVQLLSSCLADRVRDVKISKEQEEMDSFARVTFVMNYRF